MVCVIHIYRLDYLDVGFKWHVCAGRFSHGLRVQGQGSVSQTKLKSKNLSLKIMLSLENK